MSPRVYQRKFDHDDARQRYQAGVTIRAIADEMGVSWTAVQRVVVPGRKERMQQAAWAWKRNTQCIDCGAPVTRVNLATRRRCRDCSALNQATTVRADTLRCVTCRQWKPDQDFPFGGQRKTHRGRHQQCRACNTITRRDYRHRNLEAQQAYDREYKRRRHVITHSKEVSP